ncbi:MAG: transcription antitermination factor NusB [Candidatus Dormibacteraeota bacterium]|nr:transcription antitermination factor NusB [Candidatus Dormibacteraeota bacterium]
MAGSRHRARELALKALFQLESSPEGPLAAVEYLAGEEAAERTEREFAGRIVAGVLEHGEEIDGLIRAASTNWSPEQMGRVDRTVLRIAVYEIRFGGEVPLRAALNESIDLAKTFAGEESGRFVNGVLGRIVAGAAREVPS